MFYRKSDRHSVQWSTSELSAASGVTETEIDKIEDNYNNQITRRSDGSLTEHKLRDAIRSEKDRLASECGLLCAKLIKAGMSFSIDRVGDRWCVNLSNGGGKAKQDSIVSITHTDTLPYFATIGAIEAAKEPLIF